MNTLKYFDELVAGGVPPDQARTQANTLGDILGNLATKADLKDVKDELKTIKWSLLVGILLLCLKAAFHL